MSTTPGAELVQLKPVRITVAILCRGVRSFPAICTGQRDDDASPAFLLCHDYLANDLRDYPRPDRSSSFADGEAYPILQGNGVDQLDLHIDVIAGHHHLYTLG